MNVRKVPLWFALTTGALVLLAPPTEAHPSDAPKDEHPAARIVSPPPARLTVGRVGQLEVILPGPLLRPVPLRDDRPDVVLRMPKIVPHGDAYRYTIRYYATVPGEFDLTDYLEPDTPDERTERPEIPPVHVSVQSLLPAEQVDVHALQVRPVERTLRYRHLLFGLAIAWSGGTIFWFARRWYQRRHRHQLTTARSAPTIADRLSALVRRATREELSPADESQLERLLIAYWNERLGLAELRPAEAMQRLREDSQAGPLLEHLEKSLHARQHVSQREWASVLEPYQNVGGGNGSGPTGESD